MKASSLIIKETLVLKMIEFPLIVDKLQNKDPDFISELEYWMKAIEAIFKKFNIVECAEIAGLRSKIIAPLFSDATRIVSKKKQLEVAASILYDIQSTVMMVLKPHEIKLNESRDILKQLLGIVQQTGVIKYHFGDDFQNFINEIWKIFVTHEQLKPSALKIVSMISQEDALRIIAEEIVLNDWY
jgi:hypothetical protein